MEKEQVTQRAHELEHALRTFRHTKVIAKDDSGLKGAERQFMWVLANLNNGEPVMPSEIAKKLNVTMPAITHNINSLEEKGYLIRNASPDDKRVVFVSLSDKGKETVDELHKDYFKVMRGLIEYLGDEDSAKLIALVNKTAEYFKARGGAK